MSDFRDPELDDLMQGDPELVRIARVLASAKSPPAPLDDAFRAGLRRQLMDQAWDTVDSKRPWWSGFFAPQRLAWASAAAVFVIAASVVYYAAQPVGPNFTETFPQASSPNDGQQNVSAVQPIPVKFSVPMDHRSTEAAVQITPATAVAFSWSGDQLLYVTPKSGDLAPATQYQVTIGAGAKAKNGTATTQPQTVTFVTGVEPSATPSPTPSPTPATLITNEHEVTGDYPAGDPAAAVMWSADSSTIYFVANGALESVAAAGGDTRAIVPDGVSLAAMAPSGDRIAYLQGQRIEVLDLTSGTTREIPVDVAPTALAWAHDRVMWAGPTGLFRFAPGGPTKLADLPAADARFISIAPDGRHAIAQSGDGLLIVESGSGKATNLCAGGCQGSFQGWSPDGSRLVYNSLVADTSGATVTSIPSGDMSWSLTQEILLGSDTGLYEVRSDGSDLVKLAEGTFRSPVWAPDATTFTFVRGSQLRAAAGPPPQQPPPALDQAVSVVTRFMDARVHDQPDRAASFLDANGKAAYGGSSPALIPQGDPSLKRSYVVMSEVDPTNGVVHIVVRLVFAHGKVEQQATEERLTLTRAQATDPYLIDGVAVGPLLEFGKGPEVLTVRITSASVSVTFDSDLVPTSIGNVSLQDDQGQPVTGKVDYSDRTIVFSNLQLTPGAHYRLVVLPGLQDVGNHNVAAEYDLDFVGPAASEPTDGGSTTPPLASPSPAVTPSPAA